MYEFDKSSWHVFTALKIQCRTPSILDLNQITSWVSERNSNFHLFSLITVHCLVLSFEDASVL